MFLIQRNAEFLAEHSFDAFEIFFDKGEFFLYIGNAFEERIKSS